MHRTHLSANENVRCKYDIVPLLHQMVYYSSFHSRISRNLTKNDCVVTFVFGSFYTHNRFSNPE